MEALRLSTLMLLTLCARAAAAQETLPRLAPETYPPAAREQIGRLYHKAQAERDNASAVGALARVLQAWSQWEPAHQLSDPLVTGTANSCDCSAARPLGRRCADVRRSTRLLNDAVRA